MRNIISAMLLQINHIESKLWLERKSYYVSYAILLSKKKKYETCLRNLFYYGVESNR